MQKEKKKKTTKTFLGKSFSHPSRTSANEGLPLTRQEARKSPLISAPSRGPKF